MKNCEWCGKEINKEYGKLKYSIKIWCKQKVKEVYFCCYNCKSKFLKENEEVIRHRYQYMDGTPFLGSRKGNKR